MGIMFDELNVEISMQKIRKAVQLLKNGKSREPDLLINEFLSVVSIVCFRICTFCLIKCLIKVYFLTLVEMYFCSFT